MVTVFCDIKLNKFFFKFYRYSQIFLTKNNSYKSNSKLANLSIDKKNKVIFNRNSDLMNAGIYFFKKEILDKIDKTIFS